MRACRPRATRRSPRSCRWRPSRPTRARACSTPSRSAWPPATRWARRGWCSASRRRSCRGATAAMPGSGNRRTTRPPRSARCRPRQGETTGRPYFEVLFVTPTPPSRWPAHAQQIRKLRRPPGRVRLRARVRRLVRGRGAGRDPQHQPRVGGDLRRLPLRVVARRAAAEERAVVQAVSRHEGPRVGRQRPAAGGGRQALPAGARHHRARRQEARGDDRGPGGRGHPPHLLRGRGAARDPPLDPLRRRRAQRDAVLRQPQEVRAEAGGNLSRAAGGARQVDLQVELDQRHGRVLRGQPVPRGILGDLGRPGQPARAHRQHQEGAGRGRARLRRRPRVLRDQRHLDLQQDGPPGAAATGRHRDRGSQLSQVAPLRDGAGGGPAVLRRGLPDGGVLDVRRRADAQPSRRPCSTSRRRAGSTR